MGVRERALYGLLGLLLLLVSALLGLALDGSQGGQLPVRGVQGPEVPPEVAKERLLEGARGGGDSVVKEARKSIAENFQPDPLDTNQAEARNSKPPLGCCNQ